MGRAAVPAGRPAWSAGETEAGGPPAEAAVSGNATYGAVSRQSGAITAAETGVVVRPSAPISPTSGTKTGKSLQQAMAP